MKFSWKVFFCTICVVAAAFSIGSYILINSVFHTALNRETKLAFDENLMIRVTLETAFFNVPTKYETLHDSTISQIAQSIVGEHPQTGYFIRISDETLAPLYTNSPINMDNAILSKTEKSAISYQMTHIDGEYFIQTAGQIIAANRVLHLETFRNITLIFNERHRHFEIYRNLTAVMLSVVSAVMMSISLWLTRPISALSSTARAIAEGNLQKRAEKAGDDEIGSLINDFNLMADALERQVFKLQDMVRQKEEFITSFAHELKTPLTSIIGYADMLRSFKLDKEKQFCAANYVFTEGKRLEALSLKLMDMIVLRRQELEKKAVHTSFLFKNISEVFEPILSPKGVNLKINYDEAVIMAEMDLVKMLLSNLIDNAQKVTEPGGIIEFSGKDTPQGYLFMVQDFGCGIAAQELSKITEAFYVVDKSRSRAQNGAGLGLSLCAEIARLHHSRLEFESEPGKGTTVRFLLESGGENGKS